MIILLAHLLRLLNHAQFGSENIGDAIDAAMKALGIAHDALISVTVIGVVDPV